MRDYVRIIDLTPNFIKFENWKDTSYYLKQLLSYIYPDTLSTTRYNYDFLDCYKIREFKNGHCLFYSPDYIFTHLKKLFVDYYSKYEHYQIII